VIATARSINDRTARELAVAVDGGHEVARLEQVGLPVGFVALGPDGRYIATAPVRVRKYMDYDVRVTSVADGREAVLSLHGGMHSLAFSPDGGIVAVAEAQVSGGSSTGLVWFWTFEGGDREVARLGHDGELAAMAISPDGQHLAVGDEGGLTRLLRAGEGGEVARVEHQAAITGLEFSQDGELLATAGRDGTARIIAMPAGRELARVNHGREVIAVAFCDAGLFATAGNDGSIRLWSTVLDEMLERFCNGRGRNLSRVEWSRTGYLNDMPRHVISEQWPTPEG
jgi:WD40 repeat protein